MKRWQLLLVEMHKILSQCPESDNYEAQRIRLALEQRGIKVSRSLGIRAMRKRGAYWEPLKTEVFRDDRLHKSKRSPDGLTKADKKAQRPENHLKVDFSADSPNKKWLTDITLISV